MIVWGVGVEEGEDVERGGEAGEGRGEVKCGVREGEG